MPKRIEWTKDADRMLISLNRQPHVTLEEIAAQTKLSLYAVRMRIRMLAEAGKIPPREAVRRRGRKKGKPGHRPKWTPARRQQLIDLFDGKRSDEEIGDLMGETACAIQGQVWILRKAGRLPKKRRSYGRPPRAQQTTSRIFSPEKDRLLIKRVREGRTRERIAAELEVTQRQVKSRVSALRKQGLLPSSRRSKRATRARRRLVIQMYRNGRPLADIAAACKSTPGAISVMLVRLRKQGKVHLRPHPRELTRKRAP